MDHVVKSEIHTEYVGSDHVPCSLTIDVNSLGGWDNLDKKKKSPGKKSPGKEDIINGDKISPIKSKGKKDPLVVIKPKVKNPEEDEQIKNDEVD